VNIVFLGTPEIAVPTLERLFSDGHKILLAVSQPDRPSGRGRKISPTPVKKRAEELGIPVRQFDNINTPAATDEIKSLSPDIIVVVAFGQILKKELLEIPPFGCVNLHASVLPLLRGAAPINRAIMDGHAVTGVTTMKMDRGMDTGDMLLKSADIPIAPRTTAGDLEAEMKTSGAELMSETIKRLKEGSLTAIPQDASKATFARKIDPAERRIDWTLPAEIVDRRIRGLSPAHAAYTFFRGSRTQILRSETSAGTCSDAPGTVVSGDLEVATGNGRLRILEVRPEGKDAMKAADWARGARPAVNKDKFE
jgi:methionyl-tRNA formyltransferase